MAIFRDVHHLRQAAKNVTNNFTDKRLQDYFFQRTYRMWFNDPTQYVYYFLSYLTVGVSVVVGFHHLMGNPEVTGRAHHLRLQLPDRHELYSHAIPFFNHSLRNYALKFTGSLIDNEHDFSQDTSYAYRPKREKHYGRFPFVLSAPKYFVDAPEFQETSHASMEKRYREIGYYGNAQ